LPRRSAHEWAVPDDPGRIRFVPCDADGTPLDGRRYAELRAAEARGELRYLGIVLRDDLAGPTDDPDARRRSYADDLIDGAAASTQSLGGAMGLFRDN
jgi:hypothetical protein